MTTLLRRVLRLLCGAICVASVGCDSSPSQPAAVPAQSQTSVSKSEPASVKSLTKSPLPKFRRLGPESGFDFERNDDITGQRRLIEANGGGVAVFDFDHDGWIDVFMTNGCKLPLRLDDHRSPSQLYRNRADMQFERITESSRLMQFGYSTGCAVGDFDSDGFDDLYITAFGRNAFWLNNGDGTFWDITDRTGTQVPQWSTSAAFADINRDGHLDLYVANYVAESDEHPKRCPNPQSPDGFEQCPPALFEGVDDAFFVSDGAGGFVDATQRSKVAGLKGKGLGVAIADFDQDSSPEIFVANDGEANFLFVVSETSRARRSELKPDELWIPEFDERAAASGVALNEAGFAQASMGVGVGDVDRDGWSDLLVTNFLGDTNTLYTNRRHLAFDDTTRASGLGAPSRNRLGFGTMMFDANNDGWLDVIVANGHVDDRTWQDRGEPYRMQPLLQLNNGDGTFTDVTNSSGDYFQNAWLARGLAVADFDQDGRQDVVMSHQLGRSAILRNETETTSNAVCIRLIGLRSCRSAIGSRICVTSLAPPMSREFPPIGSFQSAHSGESYLDCRIDREKSVKVVWPSGIESESFQFTHGTWVVLETQPRPVVLPRSPAALP